ncbi:MAG: glucans biosynthesis glucosyltransferase MdoH [Pseudomonadota bacterium]
MTTTHRRIVFATLVLVTMAILSALLIFSISFNGISVAEWILIGCFLITLPWTVIGFWNAVIGFTLLRTTHNPARHVFPELGDIEGDEEITTSTAIAMCIRNEDVDQVARNLNAMIARLVASGNADKFHVYVLSDSSFEDVIEREGPVFDQLSKNWEGTMGVTYRRRPENPGFKAGNIRDFCERWGKNHDFMLTLDADSVMSASAILRLVRIMQDNEKLGILQSLVVGLPSDSGFTRAFQFGMRLGMKSYTIGSAWWQADCGPYWGHNALIRLKPFIDHCHLPKLSGNGPLSGWILSHDQVEAVYMRRAGYECRVLAEEGGSYEENPPHILEFIRRDLRWCHGNMQYFNLLNEPGLYLTSRIQLVLAILMFISAPAWMTFVSVATAGFLFPDLNIQFQAVGPGYTLFAIIMAMVFAPKIASFLDVLMTSKLRKQYGGTLAVIGSAFTETIFSMMLAPIMAVANTIFLFKLFVLRKAKGWVAQSRSVQALPTSVVASHLWPQMVFGAAGFATVISGGVHSVAGFLICLPVFVGPLLAIPFGVSSSSPAIGRIFAKLAFWQIPEEEVPTVIIRALDLPALAVRDEAVTARPRYTPLTTEQLLLIDAEIEHANGPIPEPVRIVA